MRFKKEIPLSGTSVIITEQQNQLLNKEFDKAIDEIKENTSDIKKWFYYKLILVGSLIGSIIYQVIRKWDDVIEYLFVVEKRAFSITIGIAFVVALIIDIQVKQNMLVTNQLGNWITHQYEPVMTYCRKVNNDSIEKIKELDDYKKLIMKNFIVLIKNNESLKTDSSSFATFLDTISSQKKKSILLCDKSLNFYSWEKFLRIEDKDTCLNKAHEKLSPSEFLEFVYNNKIGNNRATSFYKQQVNGLRKFKNENIKDSDIEMFIRDNYKVTESQHTDIFYSVFHFPAFHLLTWLLYTIFLCSIYFVIKRIPRDNKEQWIMLKFIFLAVHLAIAAFAILSRAQTSIFAMQYSLFSLGEYTTPFRSGLFNILLVVWLIIPHVFYYKYIRSRPSENLKVKGYPKHH